MSEEEQLLATLQSKADAGDREAMYEIGWRSSIGIGLPQNEPLGLRYLRMAAENGHQLAQNNLGARYVSGDGVEVDLVEAYRWFTLAAEQGDRKAGKNRDSIAAEMSPEQLAEARKRVGENAA
jgi:uncharacterized protein